MSETALFTDKGVLQQFSGQAWGQVGSGSSTIWLLQNTDTGASRIVAMNIATQAYSLNQAVTGDLAFQKATETFVQWKASDGSVYGITFDLQTPASQFSDALTKVVARLNGTVAASLPAPIAASASGQEASTSTKPTSRPTSGKDHGTGRPVSGKDQKDKDKKDKDKKEKDKDKKEKDKKDKRRSDRSGKREDSPSVASSSSSSLGGGSAGGIPAPIGGSSVPAAINETPEEAARRKRRLAAKEMLQTEESYVRGLTEIVSIYKIPMKTKGLVSDAEHGIIFSNVDTLLQVNTVLYHELKVRIENWNDATTKIGDVFVKNATYLRAYAQYFQTYNEAQSIVEGLGAKKKAYHSFAKDAEKATTHNINLPALLAMPAGRVPRYLLLLREMLNHTPAGHPDHIDLQEALNAMSALTSDLQKGMDNANFAKRLQHVISRNYVGLSPLLVPHRVLHTEGEVDVTVNGVHKGNVVLVFNDVIAFVIDTPKQKQVMSHTSFETLWLMDTPDATSSPGKTSNASFELHTPEVTYRCVAKDTSVKAQFFHDIEAQLQADLTSKGSFVDSPPSPQAGSSSPSSSSSSQPQKLADRVRKATYKWESGASYSGEWVNAKMHGRGQFVSPNGAVFEGQYVKGCLHGSGTATYKSGDVYVGEWARDLPHGTGTLTVKTSLGEKRYVGEWENGRKKGIGTMTWENGDVYEGAWEQDDFHGKGTLTKKDGSRYEGEWRQGARHGQGTFIGPSGERYEGAWELDAKHGKGTYMGPDGSQYTGDFIADQRQGSGIYRIHAGLTYEGEFIANLYTGKGTLTEVGGDSYTGQWRGGRKHGTGTLIHPNGERYEGGWNEDKRHGKGVWSNAHGIRYEGEFKDDKRSGPGTLTSADGSTYTGEWLADRREGTGVQKWTNGASYDGGWKTDVKNGQGTFTWPDGSVYSGAWVLGKRTGRGVLKTPAGTYDGEWKDDLREGQGSWTSSDGSTYTGEWSHDRRHGKGLLNGISEQIWKEGLIVKPGIQHFAPDLPAPHYFN